jgi:hypothetical protein
LAPHGYRRRPRPLDLREVRLVARRPVLRLPARFVERPRRGVLPWPVSLATATRGASRLLPPRRVRGVLALVWRLVAGFPPRSSAQRRISSWSVVVLVSLLAMAFLRVEG